MEANETLRAGTVSGTFLSILPNILSEDIAKTIILAVVGATVYGFAPFKMVDKNQKINSPVMNDTLFRIN